MRWDESRSNGAATAQEVLNIDDTEGVQMPGVDAVDRSVADEAADTKQKTSDGLCSAPPVFYSVYRISDGEQVYKGTCVSRAAESLVPGTVYGIGMTQFDASSKAHTAMAKARKSLALANQ